MGLSFRIYAIDSEWADTIVELYMRDWSPYIENLALSTKLMKLKKILFPFISILFGIFLSLILSEAIFRILPVRDSFMKMPLDSTNPVPRLKENRDMTWSCRYDFSIVTKKHINNTASLLYSS